MRFLPDTNMLVAAVRSDRGASRRLLWSALERKIVVILSVPLMIEYEAVLTRPEHLTASRLSIEDMGAVLDALAAVAEPVRLRFLWRPRLKDPADEMVLETAANGRADSIVTFNLRDLKPAAEEFGIQTMTPPEAWKEVQRRHEKK
jgi:putative PIN family toxin of toxin-antitoxin system